MVTLVLFCIYPKNTSAKTIADLRSELNEILEREKNNNNDINLTNSEINNVKNEISGIYAEINNITNTISNTEKEIEELGVKIDEKDEATKTLLASLQKTEGNSFYLEYLFGSESIEDFIYRYSITEQITGYNNDLIVEMNDMIKENEEKKIDLKNKQAELKGRQSTLATKLITLNNSKVKLYELGSSIETEIDNAKEVIQMYINAGCGENEDINTCANKLLPPDTKFWRPFINGYVTSEFGYRDALYSGGKLISSSGLHEGIDLSNGLGRNNPVYSVANGVVAAVWYDQWGGNQVTIHHRVNGITYSSSYAHFSKILVKKGDMVTKDTIIGMMGATGSATGYHTHLSISTGLRFTDYQGYDTYVARSINPRYVINFPSGERYWSDRITYYN